MHKNSIPQIAAAYIRVSTEDQTEFSPDAQRRALERYAAANGYILPESNIFVDEGISGRKAEKRPAFMEMISQAKSKEKPFTVILVHKFDRFARSREDSVVYKSLLKKECGVRVISITESIEDDKFSIILEAMLEAMAEYYSINLAEEVKKGMTEKHLKGQRQTIASFGYRIENGEMRPDEKEAPIVREIFSRFLSGKGYFAISTWLNEMGIRTHRGNPFENRTVEYIIRNPVYIGKLRWNPSGRTRRDYNNEEVIVVEGQHQPLIDTQTWENAQKRAQEMKVQWKWHGRPNDRQKDWVSGLIRCSECGCTLIFTKPHYWRCGGYAHGACHCTQHVRDDLLKKAILSQMRADLQNDDIQYKALKANASGLDALSVLQEQKNLANRKINRLREAYLLGGETPETYKKIKSTLEAEIQTIEEKIISIQSSAPAENSKAKIKNAIADTITILENPTATVAEKRAAATAIIEKCVWNKEQNILAISYRIFL